jgi:Uma2 family endonuclease
VSEHWIVDPESRSVEIHRRNDAGDLIFIKSLLPEDELTSGILPGFSVNVQTLFA